MGGQALLRNISTLRDLFLFQADQQIFVETLDVIASGRISIIHETLQVLDLRTFLFGVGVDKFKVLKDNIIRMLNYSDTLQNWGCWVS